MAPATRKAQGASTGGQSVVPGGRREDRLHRNGVTGTAETNFRIFRNFRRRCRGRVSAVSASAGDVGTLSRSHGAGSPREIEQRRHFIGLRRPSPHRSAGVSAVSASDRHVRTLTRRHGARRYAEEFGQRVVGRAAQAVIVCQLAEVRGVAGGTARVLMASL